MSGILPDPFPAFRNSHRSGNTGRTRLCYSVTVPKRVTVRNMIPQTASTPSRSVFAGNLTPLSPASALSRAANAYTPAHPRASILL